MSEELKDKKDGSNSEGSPNEFVELLKKNKKSLAVIVVIAVVLLGIGILLGSLIGSRSGKNNNLQAGAQSSEPAETQTETAVPDVPLEENADPEVNALMEKYYQAAATGDIETINSLKDYSDQAELLRIQEKSKYLESYDDINCYTKPGPEADSYVVYVTYYAKFHDIEQKVTGLNTYIVCIYSPLHSALPIDIFLHYTTSLLEILPILLLPVLYNQYRTFVRLNQIPKRNRKSTQP